MKANYYIVLRDKNNALTNWKGYEDLDKAAADFLDLALHFNAITDGDWVYDYRHNAFTNGRSSVSVCETSAELLMEILFGNDAMDNEIFTNFFSERR